MSVFHNMLKTSLEKDQSQDMHLKKFITKELLENKPLPKPFHIDCRITKKKICYCPYFEGNLINQQSKKDFQLLSYYLNNYYNGVKDHEYKTLIRKKLFIEEKIKYCQEIEDVLFFLPKYQELCQQKAETFPEKKEEVTNLSTQNREECFNCKKKIPLEQIQVKSEKSGNNIIICNECNKVMNSNNSNLPLKTIKASSSQKTKLKNANPHIHKTMLGKRKANVVWQNKHSYSQLKEKKLNQTGTSSNKRMCCWKNCNKSNNPEEFLICGKCDRAFHARCSDPPLYKPLVNRFPWFCNECKICNICQRTTAEYELLICDCCDRAFHLGCLVPKRTEIPEGRWYCDECRLCACCKQKNFENLDSFDEMEKLSKQKDEKFPETLFCGICFPYISLKQYCPICYQIIPEDSGGSFIFCDNCQLWCHSECEKISKQKFKEIKSQNPYICTRCKSKQNKSAKP